MAQDGDLFAEFVEVDGDSDVEGDEFFTFGGGVIDIDEVFGGIETDLILDGGGSVEIKEETRNSDGTITRTVKDIGLGTKGTREYILGKNDETPSMLREQKIKEDEQEAKEKSPIVTKVGDERESVDGQEAKKEEEEKSPIVIKAYDDQESVDGSVHSFVEGGGNASVCATIVELLPDLFDPVHDK